MNSFSHVPPGFRFHPTDEELVDYYLRKKVASRKIDLDVIKDVDLYRIEPWDLQERCRIGVEEQSDWYFFSHKDKKYPTGTRTNRATTAGFWKATGRDKPIYSKHCLVGMRKTLVFYKGRAPNGQKSDWIMHEYRLETNENGPPQEEGWVVCRVFKKRATAIQRDHESRCWYEEQAAFFPDFESPKASIDHTNNINLYHHQNPYSCKQEMELHYNLNMPHHSFLQLPQLESPNLPNYITQGTSQPLHMYQHLPPSVTDTGDHVTDWRVLDKFVASQLSQGNTADEPANYTNTTTAAGAATITSTTTTTTTTFEFPEKAETLADIASTSASSNQVELWK